MAAITDKLYDKYPDNKVFEIMSILTVVVSIVIMFVMIFVTMFLSITKYYNNLLKDEGYLMHTLPVKPSTLHFSKMLAAFIWITADIIVIIVNFIIIAGGLDFGQISVVLDTIAAEAGVGNKLVFMLMIAVYYIVAVVGSMSMFYASMNLGSLSNTNKGIMSVVAYFAIYIVNQAVSMIALVIYGLTMTDFISQTMSEEIYYEVEAAGDSMISVSSNEVSLTIMCISFVIIFVFAVINNSISLYIMNRKLNLE